MQCDNSDKSLEEWPTLSDVVNNRNVPDGRSNGVVSNGNNVSARGSAPRRRKHNKSRGRENRPATDVVNAVFNFSPPRNIRNNKKPFDNTIRTTENNRFKQNGFNRHHYNKHDNARGNGRGGGYRVNHRGWGSANRRSFEESDLQPISPDEQPLPAETTGQLIGGAMYYTSFLNDMALNILKEQIMYQIEYYFSEENLARDIYLRRKMNADGYLPLGLIANFNRVKSLTQDMDIIVDAISRSFKLELNDGCVRPRENPEIWPIEPEQLTIDTPTQSCASNDDNLIPQFNSLNLNTHQPNLQDEQLPMPYVPPMMTSMNGLGAVAAPSNSSKQQNSIDCHLDGDLDDIEIATCSVPADSNYMCHTENAASTANITGDPAGIDDPTSSMWNNSNYMCQYSDSASSIVNMTGNQPHFSADQAANELPMCSRQADSNYMCQYTDNAAGMTNSYSADSSPIEEVNGYEYTAPSNSVIYFNNQSAGYGVYTVPKVGEKLSSTIDSIDERQTLQNKSPEPSR